MSRRIVIVHRRQPLSLTFLWLFRSELLLQYLHLLLFDSSTLRFHQRVLQAQLWVPLGANWSPIWHALPFEWRTVHSWLTRAKRRSLPSSCCTNTTLMLLYLQNSCLQSSLRRIRVQGAKLMLRHIHKWPIVRLTLLCSNKLAICRSLRSSFCVIVMTRDRSWTTSYASHMIRWWLIKVRVLWRDGQCI